MHALKKVFLIDSQAAIQNLSYNSDTDSKSTTACRRILRLISNGQWLMDSNNGFLATQISMGMSTSKNRHSAPPTSMSTISPVSQVPNHKSVHVSKNTLRNAAKNRLPEEKGGALKDQSAIIFLTLKTCKFFRFPEILTI